MSDDNFTDREWKHVSLPPWEELIQKPDVEISGTIRYALVQLDEAADGSGEKLARRLSFLPESLQAWLVRRDSVAPRYGAEVRAAKDKAELIRISHRYMRKYLDQSYAPDPDPEVYVRMAYETSG